MRCARSRCASCGLLPPSKLFARNDQRAVSFAAGAQRHFRCLQRPKSAVHSRSSCCRQPGLRPWPNRWPSVPSLGAEDELRKQGIQDDEEQRLLSNLRITVGVRWRSALRVSLGLPSGAAPHRPQVLFSAVSPRLQACLPPLLQPLSVQSPGGGSAAPATRTWSTGKKVGRGPAWPF